jgi:hypothetical protein
MNSRYAKSLAIAALVALRILPVAAKAQLIDLGGATGYTINNAVVLGYVGIVGPDYLIYGGYGGGTTALICLGHTLDSAQVRTGLTVCSTPYTRI